MARATSSMLYDTMPIVLIANADQEFYVDSSCRLDARIECVETFLMVQYVYEQRSHQCRVLQDSTYGHRSYCFCH
jgi:hypothetical protein